MPEYDVYNVYSISRFYLTSTKVSKGCGLKKRRPFQKHARRTVLKNDFQRKNFEEKFFHIFRDLPLMKNVIGVSIAFFCYCHECHA